MFEPFEEVVPREPEATPLTFTISFVAADVEDDE